METGKLIVVSNRLPLTAQQDPSGEWILRAGCGGLVTALSPILKQNSGMWIGWTGGDVDLNELGAFEHDRETVGFDVYGVSLKTSESDLYYNGFSNEILWPLFHDFLWLCNFDPDYYPAYIAANEKFAEVTAGQAAPDDFVWVHDYHLIPMGSLLRKRGMTNRIGYFLHIPFPSADGFGKLPWRTELMQALLDYDLIGFQTAHDMQNFLRCAREFCPQAEVRRDGESARITCGGRVVQVGAFPISIDFDDFAERAHSEAVTVQSRSLREEIGDRQVLLGIDRLDYTKGIPRRIEAFAEALATHHDMQRRATLLQIIVPSRIDVSKYQSLKDEIERLIGQINGQFSQPGWTPIQYMYRQLHPVELSSYYRSADIGLITPLRDGMNLVAKEYCASNVDNKGVLILSEFAGAAAELFRYALVINPFDKNGLVAAIYRAFSMDRAERTRRMSRMKQIVRKHNVFAWAASFLAIATGEILVKPITHLTDHIDPAGFRGIVG